MYAYDKSPVNLAPRVVVTLILLVLAFLLLVARLWFLQIMRGDYYKQRSENNRLKTVYIPPPRGHFYDREGKILVKNRPAFNIEFVSEQSSDTDKTIRELSSITGVEAEELTKQLKNQKSRRRFEPKVLLQDVSRDLVAKVAARSTQLPGVIVNYYPARWYLHGDFASHVIGYIRQISDAELQSPKYAGYYQRGDLVGKYGLERKWEHFLQGKRGYQKVIVNVRGVRIKDLPAKEAAIPGHNITLNLDYAVQKAADDALKDQAGGVVAMNPKTGQIYAMASSPRFDPNMFTGEISKDQWQDLIAGRGRKLNNRAAQGAYPPGSVFKLLMGAAGLSEGVITPQTTVHCPGYLSFAGRRYHCHKRSGHGSVNLYSAIVQSCDVYFYVLGQRLGVDRIHDYASRFGLGAPTGIELVQENPGLIPSTKWKREHYKGTEQEKWFPGETLSVSIGQGASLATPLQMAVAISALVNGGKVMKPLLVQELSAAMGSYHDSDFPPKVLKDTEVASEHLDSVRKAAVGVVNDARGTGRRSKLPDEWGITVAGKTGTSQVVALSRKTDDKKTEHHAWFVGYAPAEDPEIVVSALIEHGGGGGKVAAPVVGEVLKAYFERRFVEPEEGTEEKQEQPVVEIEGEPQVQAEKKEDQE